MDVHDTLTRLGDIQAVAPFLIAQHGGITRDPIKGRDIPPCVGFVFDVDEAFLDQPWNQLPNRLNIDTRFRGDALQTVVHQAKFVLPLVFGAPQQIVDLLFHQR